MGLLFAKPEEDTYITGPWLRSPFTDGFSSIGYWNGTECEKFELKLLDCFEAMGPLRGREFCKLYFQDFKECTHKWKQQHRVIDMRLERRKQWLKGVTGFGPEVNYSEECPPMDGYPNDGMYDNNQ